MFQVQYASFVRRICVVGCRVKKSDATKARLFLFLQHVFAPDVLRTNIINLQMSGKLVRQSHRSIGNRGEGCQGGAATLLTVQYNT